MSKRITKIYVDMDGVLANFEKKWKEMYADGEPEVDKKTGKRIHKENFDEFVKNNEFAVLDPMSDMRTLVEYLNEKWDHVPIEILSSTANQKHFDTVSHQKEVWLHKHDIDWKTNFVPGKSNKYKFAGKGHVLIDDDRDNISDWNEAGGIGIHHRDALTTIALLKLFK